MSCPLHRHQRLSCLSVVLRYEDHRYQMVSSKHLGDVPSKMQQYVFIYR